MIAPGNETVVERFYEELWNQWRLGLIEELAAPAIRFRGSLGDEVVGRAGLAGYVEKVRAAFPDWHNRVDELIAVDDRVAARITCSGTHLGPLGEMAATGARVEYPGAAFFRLSGGLIEAAWVVGDTQRLWQALGRR